MPHTKADSLYRLISAQLQDSCDGSDDQRDGLVSSIRQRYGDQVQAILMYGSYLRGKRDTLLDFYVLLDDLASLRSRWQSVLTLLLPPSVHQIIQQDESLQARAKVAVMTLGQFESANRHDFHSYFWARFAQPSALAYARDDAACARVVVAVAQASTTFVRRVTPLLPDRFHAADLVKSGLSMTYRCELRSEPPGHAESLYDFNAPYYNDLIRLLSCQTIGYHAAGDPDQFHNDNSRSSRYRAQLEWWLRRILGKLLSLLRLAKAPLTFEGGLDYLLWKIGRHSQVDIQPTPLQRRFPLIFAWPLLWRLYRRGAFR